jgi:hypothetical protein
MLVRRSLSPNVISTRELARREIIEARMRPYFVVVPFLDASGANLLRRSPRK